MRIVTAFPHSVREIEHVEIPLRDGCQLAARLWLPENAETSPVPAILEYIPYRKRDRTRERDEPMHRYFAGHGYAAIRVDVRGTGDSEGLLLDEYHDQELDDALEILSWIAAQSWCSGEIGMIGKSWGGFNALQVAARRPPELRAVVSVCASDDRYADDAHYMGGCLLNENLIWGSALFTLNALPPDPELLGESWRRLWLERLESTLLFPEVWLRHQRRDEYWRRGSVCEDYAQIRCPVYAVGGWADGYTNSIPRLLAGLSAPKKGLIGPWAHVYPHEGVPAPAIGFLQECLRWWDRWLRGSDNGITAEPLLRVWMQESAPPLADCDERPGRWVTEDAWPPRSVSARRLFLAPGSLTEAKPAEAVPLDLLSPQTTGLASGSWCVFGEAGEMPRDQREDDGKSLVFDTPPLRSAVEILGAPVLSLVLACDRPVALLAARLNDVAPDGSSNRVTYGLLNLTHRDGHEEPTPLEAGRPYAIRLALNDTGHRFAAGHRIRLALSSSYWPIAWPAPEPATLTLTTASSQLELPVRTVPPDECSPNPFPPPESAPGPETTDLRVVGSTRTITRDVTTGEILHTVTSELDELGNPAMTRIDAISLEFGHGMIERFRISESDPLSAHGELLHKSVLRRDGWCVRVETHLRMSSSMSRFRLLADLDAYENDECVFSRSWDRAVPRELV